MFKTLSVGPAGVKLTTSQMITRCSTNWAIGARYRTHNLQDNSTSGRGPRALYQTMLPEI